MGTGRPALQRAVRKILGHRRFDRSDRSGGVVRREPRRRIHSGQPVARRGARPHRWSRRRICRPRGATSIRSICASKRSPSSPTCVVAAASARRASSFTTAHRHADLIDRDAAWKAKRAALESVYRVERSAGRQLAYAAYREREGRSLDDFAIWCALAEQHGPDWHRWPEELAHPASPAVADFAAEHAETVDFHRWLQWQLDDQLAAAQSTAVRAGMELGIMHDLAVGVDPNGADAWALQDVLALGVTAGAPPDEFNQLGQDWSQPPVATRPARRAGLRTVPGHGQRGAAARGRRPRRPHHRAVPALVDPQGCAADRGHLCAVRPRGDDRHPRARGPSRRGGGRRRGPRHGRTVGTRLPGPSADCSARRSCGSSSTATADGGPLPAQRWREYCLSSVTTHDLPPTAGYLAGEHVRLRDRTRAC